MRKSSGNRKRIVIVDDHPMMRQGLAQLVENEPDLMVSGEADNAPEALELLRSHPPDLLLLDISLPGKSGLEVIKDIRVSLPELPVLVVSMHDEALYAERVLRAGGRGYIMKQEGGKKLMQAIRQVLAGHVYVSENISATILDSYSGVAPQARASSLKNLSDREFQVFQLIGKGLTTREIARELHISGKTVEVHRGNIKRKLALKTGAEVVRHAIRWTEAQNTG